MNDRRRPGYQKVSSFTFLYNLLILFVLQYINSYVNNTNITYAILVVAFILCPLLAPAALLVLQIANSVSNRLPLPFQEIIKQIQSKFAFYELIILGLMAVGAFLYLYLAMYMDSRENSLHLKDHTGDFYNQIHGEEEELTTAERETKQALEDRTDIPIQAAMITKQFKITGGVLKALKGVSICLHKGETLGLLGPNGAGKSTMFNILSTFFDLTDGQVKAFGKPLKNQTDFFKGVGLVAQDNILWNNLSVKSHLSFIRAMRGIPQSVEKDWLELMDLQKFQNNRPQQLSSGMKRKLCFLMIAMGNPMYKFLDEVSTGLDPMARKRIREILANQKKLYGSATLLTTHTMNEAEMACDRLMILVNGETCLLDTVNNLRRNTGGFNLTLFKTGSSEFDYEGVQGELAKVFGFGSEVFWNALEDTEAKITYDLAEVDDLPSRFDRLQDMVDNGIVKDFTFSRKSLEDLFVSLSRNQAPRQDGH